MKKSGSKSSYKKSSTCKSIKGGSKNWIDGAKLKKYQNIPIKGGSDSDINDAHMAMIEAAKAASLETKAIEDAARMADADVGRDGDSVETRDDGSDEKHDHGTDGKYDDDTAEVEDLKKAKEMSLEGSKGSSRSEKPDIHSMDDAYKSMMASSKRDEDSNDEIDPRDDKSRPPKKVTSSTTHIKRDQKSSEMYETHQLKAQQEEIRRENQRLMNENKRISENQSRINAIHNYDSEREYRLKRLLLDLVPDYPDLYYRDSLKQKINELVRRQLIAETKVNDTKSDSEMVKIVKSLIQKSIPSRSKKSAKKSSKKKSSKKKTPKKSSKKKSSKKKTPKKASKKKSS